MVKINPECYKCFDVATGSIHYEDHSIVMWFCEDHMREAKCEMVEDYIVKTLKSW